MPPIAYLISPPSSPSKSSSPSSPSSRTTTRYISSSPLLPTYNNRREEDVDVEVDIEEEDDDWENIDIDYYQCDERRKERRSSTANSAVRYVKAIQKVAQRYGGGCMSGTERRLMERLVKEKRG